MEYIDMDNLEKQIAKVDDEYLKKQTKRRGELLYKFYKKVLKQYKKGKYEIFKNDKDAIIPKEFDYEEEAMNFIIDKWEEDFETPVERRFPSPYVLYPTKHRLTVIDFSYNFLFDDFLEFCLLEKYNR